MGKITYLKSDVAYVDKVATERLIGVLTFLGVATVLVPHTKVVFLPTSSFNKLDIKIIIPGVVLLLCAALLAVM